MKKKIIVPLIVFMIGIGVLGGIVYNVQLNQQKQNMMAAELNAMTYAERMKNEIMQQINITDTLQQILISENGTIDQFHKVAEKMLTDSVQSIQIAPDGVVTDIYPEEGNEAGKIDLLNDKDRGEISRYARDHHTLIVQGPFELKQGGYGMAVRNPVYLEDENGEEYFWGFTIVIIRVPDIFAESERALTSFGYQYQLSKTVSPWDSTYKEVYRSGGEIVHPASYSFEVGGEHWKLEIVPKSGWMNDGQLYMILIAGIWIVLLLTGLTGALLNLDENRKNLQKMAITDSLTGIYNRQGFDELVTAYMKKNPMKHCVVAQFDVDDFKLINDMYGHDSGDRALQSLAEGMKSSFSNGAVLGRNGGDEFCIILKNCTCTEVEKEIEAFTQMPRKFRQGGVEYKFSISLGYAEAPVLAANRFGLFRNADAALYEVKLRGKHGCLAYNSDLHLDKRTQLGFALNDISDYLPEAFLIYKADRDNDQILFSSGEMIRFAGCTDMDDFLEYTKRSFRSLISETERELVENTVWQQVASKEQGALSYVGFNFQGKDGVIRPVVACGRVVENQYYGKVFYVVISDRFGR